MEELNDLKLNVGDVKLFSLSLENNVSDRKRNAAFAQRFNFKFAKISAAQSLCKRKKVAALLTVSVKELVPLFKTGAGASVCHVPLERFVLYSKLNPAESRQVSVT